MTARSVNWHAKNAGLVVGALVVPFFAMAAYLIIVRKLLGLDLPAADFVALILSVGCGLACLWFLPLSLLLRVILAVPYAFVAFYAVFMFALFFMCPTYPRCSS